MHNLTSRLAPLLLSVFFTACIAYPFKNNFHEAHEGRDPKDVRNLDGIGGGNLLRDLDILRNRAAMYERQSRNYDNLDSLAGITLGSQKRSWPDNFNAKRNLDKIDNVGFDSFVKRNLDTIDNVGFPGFTKRNFDTIDNAGFNGFVKRSAPLAQTVSPDHHN